MIYNRKGNQVGTVFNFQKKSYFNIEINKRKNAKNLDCCCGVDARPRRGCKRAFSRRRDPYNVSNFLYRYLSRIKLN